MHVVVAFGEGAFKHADSGIGSIGGGVGGDWIGWARDEGRGGWVCVVVMEVMGCILKVRHAERHGSSRVVGDTKCTSR